MIDFGTSCYEGSSQSRAPDYVQTRYYRAPEVKLDNNHLDGNPDCAGDDGCGVHWSGRHVEPRLHRGRASHWQTSFSWEAEADQLALIMEVVILTLTVTVMVIGDW